jgi:hypothetical protein
MGEKTYELSGYESEMIKPKELIEIKEATEILLALYAPQTAYALTSVLDNPDGFIESFNGKLRDECLNETLFGTLRDARKTLEEWQEDYNWRRPHSALSNLTPMEFLQRKAMDKMAA